MMKSLADWLCHLEKLHPKGQGGIELGLERVARVKAALQQSPFCPVIIVGGTNGKGSTCAYLEAIYRAAGYRTGCYTSPHLLAYSERVRLDGVPVADALLCDAFARVEAARQLAGEVALTYFEFGTLAAWEVFAEAGVEVAILEVGLGGRLDAVNVYEPDCSIVTGIALDHTDWLGATREAIGFEKAGIFRAGKPALCADVEPPKSLLDHAAAIGAELRLIGRDFDALPDATGVTFAFREAVSPGHAAFGEAGRVDSGVRRNDDLAVSLADLPRPALRGECQWRNAAAVLAAVSRLQARLPVTRSAIANGLRNARLPGRFEIVAERPAVILDVAHNPQAVNGLVDNLAAMACGGRTLAVVGMLADKDIAGALVQLRGKVDVWLLASLDVPRGASVDVLAQVVGSLGGRVECLASPEAAFAHAVGLAGENDRIAVFGSFYTVAAVMRVLAHPA